jgi:hypothetical protein
MTGLQSYRLYRLDRLGKVKQGEWIEASDDAEAQRLAREFCGLEFPAIEVWQGRRLVATVHCDDPAG